MSLITQDPVRRGPRENGWWTVGPASALWSDRGDGTLLCLLCGFAACFARFARSIACFARSLSQKVCLQIIIRSGKNSPRHPADGEMEFICTPILGAGKVSPTERFLVNPDDNLVVLRRDSTSAPQ